jgi:hypothetical protein
MRIFITATTCAWRGSICGTAPGPMSASRRRSAIFAAHHGKLEKYHQTMTIAWMRLVEPAASMERFEDAVASFPRLLDKNYLREFYSDGRLGTEEAREKFVAPDKRAFDVVK